MWRRVCSQLAPWRSTTPGGAAVRNRAAAASFISSSALHSCLPSPSPFQQTAPLFSTDSGNASLNKRVEDVMPIATGHEREELEAELEGRKRFDMDAPVGPFGTKEAPAVIQSYYNKRIVGCPGGEGEDEHDVVWFWLEKGKPHECPVCSQYFVLEVIGEGGDPEALSDDDHH
ncbi:cytochrome c oxidase subunit 5b-2, mitochondrial [Elaeis guineensis]|uniref:Cytochrome c oxidase subunit 5b-2, mitochondrial n=1 Tax=Elaeis guineensis var. tenera TaxID=51953 RepID=A0A6I9RFP0_ELAGV|nr:cytochrome c oxidase subunit 5b-2, mitochondrial [Elaeis guineensis]